MPNKNINTDKTRLADWHKKRNYLPYNLMDEYLQKCDEALATHFSMDNVQLLLLLVLNFQGDQLTLLLLVSIP